MFYIEQFDFEQLSKQLKIKNLRMDTSYYYFELDEFYHGKNLSLQKVEKDKELNISKLKNKKTNKAGEKNRKS